MKVLYFGEDNSVGVGVAAPEELSKDAPIPHDAVAAICVKGITPDIRVFPLNPQQAQDLGYELLRLGLPPLSPVCSCPAPRPGREAVKHVDGCHMKKIIATYACSFCGAKIGEPCVADGGTWIMPGIHSAVRGKT